MSWNYQNVDGEDARLNHAGNALVFQKHNVLHLSKQEKYAEPKR